MRFGPSFGGSAELFLSGRIRLALEHALLARARRRADDEDSNTRHLAIQTGLLFPVG